MFHAHGSARSLPIHLKDIDHHSMEINNVHFIPGRYRTPRCVEFISCIIKCILLIVQWSTGSTTRFHIQCKNLSLCVPGRYLQVVCIFVYRVDELEQVLDSILLAINSAIQGRSLSTPPGFISATIGSFHCRQCTSKYRTAEASKISKSLLAPLTCAPERNKRKAHGAGQGGGAGQDADEVRSLD